MGNTLSRLDGKEMERRMTAYEKIAAEACQWCAKGLRQYGVFMHARMWHLPVELGGIVVDCMAPSTSQVIERLAAENKRLREAMEKAEHARMCRKHHCSCVDGPNTILCSKCDCNCHKAALAAPAQEMRE